MTEVIVFAGRNIKRYFRDVGVMLFSLLSVFIVVALYVFFLTDMQIESIKAVTGNIDGIENMIIAWVVGGLLCIPAISVPVLVLCFKVDDLVDGIQDDLFITPMNRSKIMLGYVLAAWIVGFVMSVLTLVLYECYIVFNGGQLLKFWDAIQAIGILGLIVLVFSGVSFFIILFLKSKSAITVVASILNTLLGFFLGLFVPVGVLSDNVAAVIKASPILQAAAWLRNIVMRDSLEKVTNIMGIQVVDQIKDTYGVDIALGERLLSTSDIMIILITVGVVFYGASVFVINRTKRT